MGFEWNPEGQSQQRLTGMPGWARWGARFSWTDSAGLIQLAGARWRRLTLAGSTAQRPIPCLRPCSEGLGRTPPRRPGARLSVLAWSKGEP